jgi:beta-glucanase (GH16 family)
MRMLLLAGAAALLFPSIAVATLTLSEHSGAPTRSGLPGGSSPALGSQAGGVRAVAGPTGSTGAAFSAPTSSATSSATDSPGAGASAAGSSLSGVGSAIVLPSGFAPIAHYTHLAQDFEFDGSSLPAGWSAGVGNYGYDATDYQPSQVGMTGSSVALAAVPQPPSQGLPYLSGWISTAGGYTLNHGLIDFRARVPSGQGLWPAVWMCNSTGVEIDVAELLAVDPQLVYGSLHDGRAWSETQSTALTADASAGYHDYEVVWQPGMITWAVDGVAFAQYTKAAAQAAGLAWLFDDASGVYLIANLAVGAADDWGGAPSASTLFPAVMQIQSVRVWQ